jgi:cellulose synthase/poly-beta-1,6-N-acetylglucosamine synthase-like glycosyltransferase
MIGFLRSLNRVANRHAGKLLLLGLAGVAWHNWRLWQRDKALLAERVAPPPRPPLDDWSDLPPVSVLVAAWNEADMIEDHIASFLALRYPCKELVLCAGGKDGTYEIARRHAGEGVVVLEQRAGEGKQWALARSFAESRGDVVFLTDADCILDDDAFERTIHPLGAGREQVCTGTSRPLAHQLRSPFVVSQAASQIYGSLRAPEYVPGLLGRNCAVRRDLLLRSRGLEAPAASGTDYVLAKELLRAGARIRHVPHSRVLTHYPTDPLSYVRQQRRWLRNVVLHGRRFAAGGEVRASLRTSLVGATMLLLPLLGLLVTPWLLAAWGVLAAAALFARFRYLGLAAGVLDRRVRPADVAWQGPMLLLDLVAWTQPLADYARQRNRWAW